MKLSLGFLFLLAAGFAQQARPPAQSTNPSEAEDQELSQALAEAGQSMTDFIRAIEKHLAKRPRTAHRAQLERALVKAAIEGKDEARIIRYGELVLVREPDDVQILDCVARALLSSESKENAAKALPYAKRYEETLRKVAADPPPGRMSKGQWQEETDRSIARALVLEARATGNLGRIEAAAQLAERSYGTFPTAEGAREIARWQARTGKEEEAVQHLADAFVLTDPRATDLERAKDRARMGELYRKLKGSETGLGDLILQAYDRTTGLLAARRLRLRLADPNTSATKVLDFTLSGLDGRKLELASLKGKTIVFDFWATWCGPCRVQHPLYEEVKKRFRGSPEVVFLSVSTDEEKELVEPFLKEQQWGREVWFEDGLSRALTINSIPTTIIVDKTGEVASRMNGFNPERFVDRLAERIRDALKN